MKTSQITDAELLRQYVREKDSSALGRLFKRHSDNLFGLAITYLKNASDAEDAVQTAFLKVAQKSSGFEFKDNSSIRSWMMTIVANTCKDAIKTAIRRRKREEIASENYAKAKEDSAESSQQGNLSVVKQAMGALPEHYRVPIFMHYQQDLSVKHIAEILSLSENTIYSQIKRGVEKLRYSVAKVGTAVTAIMVINTLKATQLQAAPATLSQNIDSWTQSIKTSSRRRTTCSSASSSANGIPLWIYIAGAISGIALIIGVFWQSQQTQPKNSAKPAVIAPATKTPTAIFSCNFDKPLLPPELKILNNARFTFIPNKGQNGTGCFAPESYTQMLIDIPIESLPLKITTWCCAMIPPDKSEIHKLYKVGIFWQRHENTGIINLSTPLTNSASSEKTSWRKIHYYITRRYICSSFGNDRFMHFIYYYGSKGPKLKLEITSGYWLDNLSIQTISTASLPPVLNLLATKLKSIPPEKRSGRMELPQSLTRQFSDRKYFIKFRRKRK